MDWLGKINAKKSKSVYSLEYLIPYFKTIPKLETSLDFATAKPIRIRSKIQSGFLDFYLAPRVEN
jgi:hypothetical protein